MPNADPRVRRHLMLLALGSAALFVLLSIRGPIGGIGTPAILVIALLCVRCLVGSALAARSVSRGRVVRGLTILGASSGAAFAPTDLTALALVPQLNAAYVVARVEPLVAADDRVGDSSKLTDDDSIVLGPGRRAEVLGEAEEL